MKTPSRTPCAFNSGSTRSRRSWPAILRNKEGPDRHRAMKSSTPSCQYGVSGHPEGCWHRRVLIERMVCGPLALRRPLHEIGVRRSRPARGVQGCGR
eukprot:3514381-Prymnesium_polylepis.1